MKIKDQEVDFDIFDADDAERYEAALARAQAVDTTKVDGLAAKIRTQCEAVFNFFDEVLGDGFHKKLFGERTNLMDCMSAFEEFIAAANDRQEEVQAFNARIHAEYTRAKAAKAVKKPKK